MARYTVTAATPMPTGTPARGGQAAEQQPVGQRQGAQVPGLRALRGQQAELTPAAAQPHRERGPGQQHHLQHDQQDAEQAAGRPRVELGGPRVHAGHVRRVGGDGAGTHHQPFPVQPLDLIPADRRGRVDEPLDLVHPHGRGRAGRGPVRGFRHQRGRRARAGGSGQRDHRVHRRHVPDRLGHADHADPPGGQRIRIVEPIGASSASATETAVSPASAGIRPDTRT
ncbi:hypothetical protein [Acrocarpospora corrugata]|uniref:hypothetical protein n=1 Tax=Acrocarpospora corrugata TaxID=35763 RepID=UPI0012D335F4|nr:hypothetical protein [Acrocarpospora corrugata]